MQLDNIAWTYASDSHALRIGLWRVMRFYWLWRLAFRSRYPFKKPLLWAMDKIGWTYLRVNTTTVDWSWVGE